ncbi:hypothetical protein IAT38_006950 [Cryptococcus sp. DSM 104549]
MSFFSRSRASTKTSASASSSSSDLKLKDSNTTESPAAAKTHEIFTTPGEESVVKKKWEYDEHQLKQYTKTLLLPETHAYHPWELRFLSDPGTHPRFMRAAKWKMDDAKKRIKGTIEWRREFEPELIKPGDVGIEAETGKIILTGFDFDGRPVLYMRPGRENTETSPRQIRHLIYHLERAIDFMPPGQEQVCIIVDYKSATSQSNPSISTGRKVLNILQNHYVERLGRGVVVNMPWWINAFFSGITPFMDPITRDKIRFNPKVTDLVPASMLDHEFGGDYMFEFEHKSYWKTVTEFCHIAEDGTRVDSQGAPWVPPLGNGIKAAVDGLVPAPGAVTSGHVVSSSASSVSGVNGVKDTTAAGGHGAAVATGAAASASATDDATEQTAAQKIAAENATSTTGNATTLEEDVAKLTVGVDTVPGEPVGEGVFDHPPTKGEIQEAKKSLEVGA